MTRPFFTRVVDAFAIFGAATKAAAAVENRGQLADRDLQTLGIDPATFRAIGR